MTRSATAQAALSGAGSFATARRGGLTSEEKREIRAHRYRDRPTPWQALAKRYGRPEEEIRALFDPAPIPNAENDDWPYGPCDEAVKAVVRAVASGQSLTVADLAERRKGGSENTRGHVWQAQRAAISAVHHAFPRLTFLDLEGIFLRDKAYIADVIGRRELAA
jgi:hypothetical protein